MGLCSRHDSVAICAAAAAAVVVIAAAAAAVSVVVAVVISLAMQLARSVIGIAGRVLLAMAIVSTGLGLWLAESSYAFATDTERAEGRVIDQRESPQGAGRSMFSG
ncbi:MAG TPA: hypothetical protein PK403_08895 [Plasticicumulans sp.]|jgi:hypothetical protein|nr:hypothetical protein [Plasticicumulans sp.]